MQCNREQPASKANNSVANRLRCAIEALRMLIWPICHRMQKLSLSCCCQRHVPRSCYCCWQHRFVFFLLFFFVKVSGNRCRPQLQRMSIIIGCCFHTKLTFVILHFVFVVNRKCIYLSTALLISIVFLIRQ